MAKKIAIFRQIMSERTKPTVTPKPSISPKPGLDKNRNAGGNTTKTPPPTVKEKATSPEVAAKPKREMPKSPPPAAPTVITVGPAIPEPVKGPQTEKEIPLKPEQQNEFDPADVKKLVQMVLQG